MKVYFLQKPYEFGGFLTEFVRNETDEDKRQLLALLKDRGNSNG